MTFKTGMRIVAAGLLLALYYCAPGFLTREVDDPLGFDTGRVTRFTVGTGEGETVVLEKGSSGDWRLDGAGGVVGDPGVIAAVLSGLAEAKPTPAPKFRSSGEEPFLELKTRWGRALRIELGPRVVPFRQQVIFVDDRPYEIGFDLSAALGFWEREGGWTVAALLENVPVAVNFNGFDRVRWENPFATYELERGGNGWCAGGSHRERVPSGPALDKLAEQLRLVAVHGPAASADEMPADLEPESRVVLESADEEVAFAIAALPDRADTKLFRLEAPEETDWLALPHFVANRLAPTGASLFESPQRFATGATEARVIRYERGRHQVELVQGGGGVWQVTKPHRNRPIYRPPPGPEDPRPLNRVQEYAAGLAVVTSREHFVADTPARTALASEAFATPAARILIESRRGESTEILFSEPVGSTGKVLVSVNGEIGVVSESLVWALTPDADHFFIPWSQERKALR